MIPNTGGTRCVLASDINGLVFNQSQGFGIGLSPYFTPEYAAKRLDNCLQLKGVRKEYGTDLGTAERRAIFCRCNEEITDTKNLICESGSYSEGSQFSRSDCSKLATALQRGGIGILNVCLPPPLMMLGHAVTVTKVVCDEVNGGAQVSYIDSNDLSKGVINTEITSSGKLVKSPSIRLDAFSHSTDTVCGFIAKTPPHSPNTDPVAREE